MQTHEEATFHVRELDRFLTVQILEDTLGVFSLGKLCEDHENSWKWANGQKTMSKNVFGFNANAENYVPIVVYLQVRLFIEFMLQLQHHYRRRVQGSILIPAFNERQKSKNEKNPVPDPTRKTSKPSKKMRITSRNGNLFLLMQDYE